MKIYSRTWQNTTVEDELAKNVSSWYLELMIHRSGMHLQPDTKLLALQIKKKRNCSA